jgi:hypothetical protein
VIQYRVTKYNPAFRDERGTYTKDEWISVKQVGECFGGTVLTREEYERVEKAYANAALAFLQEAGVATLTVVNLENHQKWPLQLKNGSKLNLADAVEVIRRLLREEFWCRLQANDAFIHIDWDYYMYVGVPHACPAAKAEAASLGLFVEEYQSPCENLD